MSAPNRMLQPPLGIQAPLNDLERLWLETSCYYAVFNETVMEDTLWDLLARELWERREETWKDTSRGKVLGLSPYFCHAVGLPWPVSKGRYCEESQSHVPWEEGENPLKTAMGIDWTEGLPAIVVEGIKKEGPKRLAMWESRIRGLHIEHRRGPLGPTPKHRR